jgi:outer membrane protein assembly factor BamB
MQSGQELWAFGYEGRFEEVVSGAGPRATPTFHGGRIYAVGATGTLHCLNAANGKFIWKAAIIPPEVKAPEWGYASSPVIVGSAVVVSPGRPSGSAVVAFHRESGQRLWGVGAGEHSYTSPQLTRLGGMEQVLALTSAGLTSIDPATGATLWFHEWPANQIARCVQPYVEQDSVLISTYFGVGSRMIQVNRTENEWSTNVRWESKDLKPYFNDLVVQDGYAYGFDGNIFCCVELASGKRAWKGGRYGSGQVLLLKQQKQLLVLSEQGEVILLEASPAELRERGRFPAIAGKTWNHPVVAHGKLFVRNADEMACFDVARNPAQSTPSHQP